MPCLRARRGTSRLAATLLIGILALPAGAAAAEEPADCAGFMAAMTQTLADQHAQFERPLIVSRIAPIFGFEVYDLVTERQVDGSLRCRGGRLVRFEAKITVPADAALLRSFEAVQAAALTAALKWQPQHAATALREMSGEAAEYLRASIERGDVYLSGKTEYHEGGSDLGMIWTNSDRTFIIVGSE